jgi:hypothetical protein
MKQAKVIFFNYPNFKILAAGYSPHTYPFFISPSPPPLPSQSVNP